MSTPSNAAAPPPANTGSSSPSRGGGLFHRSSGPKSYRSPAAIMVIVLGAVLIAQAATLAILGEESVQTGTNTTNECFLNIFGWCPFGITQTNSVPDPSAVNAQNIATALLPWFIVFDAFFVIATVYIVVKARSGPSRGSGREIGHGTRSRHARRRR